MPGSVVQGAAVCRNIRTLFNSSVLAYLYLPGERTMDAEALLEREPDWAMQLRLTA
jgi:hypothetical protein